VAVSASLAGPANGAGAKVAVGDYQANPIVPANQEHGVGVFSVTKAAGTREIVRSNQFAGIYYPDSFECADLDLPLAAESIPISPTGRFRISERIPVDDAFVRVSWKGHWSQPRVVSGSIAIKYDGCSSTHRWTGGKVG